MDGNGEKPQLGWQSAQQLQAQESAGYKDEKGFSPSSKTFVHYYNSSPYYNGDFTKK